MESREEVQESLNTGPAPPATPNGSSNPTPNGLTNLPTELQPGEEVFIHGLARSAGWYANHFLRNDAVRVIQRLAAGQVLVEASSGVLARVDARNLVRVPDRLRFADHVWDRNLQLYVQPVAVRFNADWEPETLLSAVATPWEDVRRNSEADDRANGLDRDQLGRRESDAESTHSGDTLVNREVEGLDDVDVRDGVAEALGVIEAAEALLQLSRGEPAERQSQHSGSRD